MNDDVLNLVEMLVLCQGWVCTFWDNGGTALGGQAAVRQCVPSRHWGDDVPPWPHVLSGAREHGHHWMCAHFLQVRVLTGRMEGN